MTRKTTSPMKPGQTYTMANGDYLTLVCLYKEGGRWIWECDGVITSDTGVREARTLRVFASSALKSRNEGNLKLAAA